MKNIAQYSNWIACAINFASFIYMLKARQNYLKLCDELNKLMAELKKKLGL